MAFWDEGKGIDGDIVLNGVDRTTILQLVESQVGIGNDGEEQERTKGCKIAAFCSFLL